MRQRITRLYVKVERRFANGFSLLGSYTFSKIIDDVVGGQTGFAGESFVRGDLQNFYDNTAERSIASSIRRRALVISYVYELPFGPGKTICEPGRSDRQDRRRLADQRQHAIPERDAFADYRRQQQRAMAGDVAAELERHRIRRSAVRIIANAGRARYFDTSVFSLNPAFTFGTAPRIMPNLYGPGAANFDISLFKTTEIKEKWRLQFRAEAFNAFNRAQFGNPVTSITSNTFGRITTQANLPRDFQLALRLLF